MKKKDTDKPREHIITQAQSRSAEHRVPEMKARPERRGLEHRPRGMLLMDTSGKSTSGLTVTSDRSPWKVF